MVWVKRMGAAWVGLLLCGFVAFVGCSDPKSNSSCKGYCDNLCSSLEACDVEVEDCRTSCNDELGDRACQGQEAPDRLTCAQLTEVVACSQYCVALCDRAPSCGTFNARACVNGCLEAQPSICNAASVAARTCDQLKPEIRLYEQVGADDGGGHAFGSSSGAGFGLCADADDCDEPLGCSQQTNTCGACTTNDDCTSAYGARACNDDGECEDVACVVDDDCYLGRPCNTETHECGECRENADCTLSFLSACDVDTQKCVECNEDSDCSADYRPSCDVEAHKCVECGQDSDCAPGFGAACDTDTRTCVACNEDAHCGNEASPACDVARHECVGCLSDEHCSGDYPRCHVASQSCRECTSNADCKVDSPRCDTAALYCGYCKTNADCEDRDQPYCTESGACGDCDSDDDCPQGKLCDTYDGTCVAEL